ncbi:hypothetical protein GOC87_18785 [Sinorhizobium meliloti]|uniref:hypothetical protein n=1 Tax=Rhizobium meliloti TaxID=382 RepID=UPI000B49BD6F|nr:hypothetical protein [Sinorhizobium meliloti]ASP96719.1 hypothetical protein CDO24_04280 [Sinorhizobium meliloti]MDW9705631.1 hypothetical protein [Sinorhizobium meliloti]MDW9935369.1 hypothetical protein [Sinorhizobium meliloti]MDX0101725.1 hypothetical protein [Sinorhizobium meliloti]MDX0120520.1 hypothetical protein [Sinorhizobium meliloti]
MTWVNGKNIGAGLWGNAASLFYRLLPQIFCQKIKRHCATALTLADIANEGAWEHNANITLRKYSIRDEPSYFPIFGLGLMSGVIVAVTALFSVHVTPEQANGLSMNYGDLVAILLTATSTIITILGVFVAVLAVWGYSQFEKMTKEASSRHLEVLLQSGKFRDEVDQTILRHVSAELAKDTSPFRDLLRQQIETMIYTDAGKRQASAGETNTEAPFNE